MSDESRDTPFHSPFSSMAVARISDADEQTDGVDITVPTDAINEATAYVTEYFQAGRSTNSRQLNAAVILILGELGTGKTHLAGQLVRTAAELSSGSVQSVHIEANGENLLRTYQQMLDNLGLDRVRARVSDFYADIVARQLDTGLSGGVVDSLRNREVTPREVVSGHSLMESALLREVRKELQVVTQQKTFVEALALLLRPGFDDAVWSWLHGAEPAPILVERGITEQILTTIDLFEAMGVLALLFGGRERRFLLVIDEFDQIFSLARRVDDGVMTGFQKMLEVFTKAEACLVLCGQPNFLNWLGPANRNRITATVQLTGLTVDQARQFIELAQDAEFGEARLEPFTPDAVAYMVALTNGNTRQFIRMCHRLFQEHHNQVLAGDDQLITDAMVRGAARRQFGVLGSEEIDAAIREALTVGGRNYRHQHLLGSSRDTMVDFWLTFDDRQLGCALFVAGSLVSEADTAALGRRISAVQAAVPDVQCVVVVNGTLGPEQSDALRDIPRTEVTVYSARTFIDDLGALVRIAHSQLPPVAVTDQFSTMNQRMDELNRRQAAAYNLIGQLADHVDRAADQADQRLDALRREISGLRGVVRGGDDDAPTDPAQVLPAQLRRLFTEAIRALDEVTQVEPMLNQALAPDAPPKIITTVQGRVSNSDYREAIAIATLLRHVITAFRDRMVVWFTSNGLDQSTDAPPTNAESQLEDVCRSYDAVVEFLPPLDLEALVRFTRPLVDGPTPDTGRQSRHRRLLELVEALGPNVRQAARRALLTGG